VRSDGEIVGVLAVANIDDAVVANPVPLSPSSRPAVREI
jgi:hypothetical protein